MGDPARQQCGLRLSPCQTPRASHGWSLCAMAACGVLLGGMPHGPPLATAAPSGPQSASRIALDERRVLLTDLARRLATAGRLNLAVSPELSAEPIRVVVHDWPVGDVLRQVALLLDAQWTSKGGPGGPTYLLQRPVSSQRRELTLRKAAEGAALDSLRREVRRYAALSQATPESLACLAGLSPREDPQASAARRLLRPCGQTLARLADALPASAWVLLRQGRRIHWADKGSSGLRLPPWAHHALKDARLDSTPALTEGEPPPSVRPQPEGGNSWSAAAAYRVHAFLSLTPGPFGFCAELFVVPAAVSPTGVEWLYPSGMFYTRAFSFPAHRPATVLHARPTDQRAFAASIALGFDRPDACYQMPGTVQASDVFHRILQGSTIGALSDAYASIDTVVFPLPRDGQMPTIGAVDRYMAPFRSVTCDAGFVRARAHSWFVARALEVPAEVSRDWLCRHKSGGFSLDDYVAIARGLGDRPARSFAAWARIAGIPSVEVVPFLHSHPALHFLATLRADQWRAVAADGLPISAMADAQRQSVLAILRSADMDRLREPRMTDLVPFQLRPEVLPAATRVLVRPLPAHSHGDPAPTTQSGHSTDAHTMLRGYGPLSVDVRAGGCVLSRHLVSARRPGIRSLPTP